MNRALKVIKILEQAPNKTLYGYQIEKLLPTNWAPRPISEARALKAVITGENPYTLVSYPSNLFDKKSSKKTVIKVKPIRYEYVGNTAIPIYQ